MSGINSEAVATFGRVTLKFFDKPCPLDILRDDFPIEYDGILGMEFLRTQKAHETYYLHARTKTLVDLDCDFEEGSSYVPCIRAGPGIFAGESLVKIQNYRAPLFITNSMSYDINLTLPPIKRCDFETSTRVRLARPKIKPPHGPETERIDSVLRELNLDSLNSDERAHIINLVAKFPQQFHLPSDHLSMTTASTHKIVTTDDIPINVKQYRHPPYLRDKIQKQITELITNDIVEESDSPYNSPLWIVPKKAGPDVEKKWRQVIDYCMLNEKTIASTYPLPNITEILDQLGSSKYFTTLDLQSAFYQVPIEPCDEHKTAFSTPFHHLHFKRMPMDLKGPLRHFKPSWTRF
ncbi:hypothetical protein TKK_0013715 [Trichogramma kaykai]